VAVRTDLLVGFEGEPLDELGLVGRIDRPVDGPKELQRLRTPEVATTSPSSTEIVVVFPAPFGPR